MGHALFSTTYFRRGLVLLAALFVSALQSSFARGQEMEKSAEAESDPPSTPAWIYPDEFLAAQPQTHWPTPNADSRPGAIWWWPASAVSKQDLTWNLETYRNAGWGNLGIVGIYGVKGEEKKTIDLFSERWFEMYNHAHQEAQRLEMNIDLTPSGGWRWGGPHVTAEFAEQSFEIKDGKLTVKKRKDKVKRAGPGGIGMTVNPYSAAAVKFHLDWFDQRLKQNHARAPRSFYYDSFENNGNWCPEFEEAFHDQHGYSLKDYATELAAKEKSERARRILADYRETLSSLLIQRVVQIADWGQRHGSSLRMQAHGAPANLLDMYAAGGIPETEVFGASKFDIPGFRRDPQWIRADQQSDLVNRFASSAAHVAGRPRVTAESFTWLRNHFHTSLTQIKAEADGLLLNGINGIYYHGACFSPQKTEWPGWLFYASTQANPRNSIFRDIGALNAYITRCQSVLQSGRPHNDILLYWPVYDLWMGVGEGETRPDQRYTVHHPEWIEESSCGEIGRHLLKRGFAFDFVSDSQLLNTQCQSRVLITEGQSRYRVILVPAVEYLPVKTASKLIELARQGAKVLIWKQLPSDVPGFHRVESRQRQLASLFETLSFDQHGVAKIGRGQIVLQNDLDKLLEPEHVQREPMADLGLQFIRRISGDEIVYLIVNHTSKSVDCWTKLSARLPSSRSALLMDPMTGKAGLAATRVQSDESQVYLQMQPGDTRILRCKTSGGFDEADLFQNIRLLDDALIVDSVWEMTFLEGGPDRPDDRKMTPLRSWAEADDPKSQSFAGAARYTTQVNVPDLEAATGWMIDLGDVRESARVWVNDQPVGVLVAHPFRLDLGDALRPGVNELKIEVTNLSANRVRDLDRRGVAWKKFYDINFVSHLYQPFDASDWKLEPSGLLGPVRLIPYCNLDVDTPTLHLIGDSTVKTGRGVGEGGQWGWGSFLDNYLDRQKIHVANHARGGRSSRTFLTEGRWEMVLEKLKPGDSVLIQFGHNDSGEKFAGDRPRASRDGNGDDFEEGVVELTGRTEKVYSYGWYLRKFIREAKNKGANPVVLSPVPRKIWDGKRLIRSNKPYPHWAKQAAEIENAPFVDLNEIVAKQYEQLGKEAVEAMFADERTHTSRQGAQLNAKSVVWGLSQLSEGHWREFLSPDFSRHDPLGLPHERPYGDTGSPDQIPTLFIIGDSTVKNGHKDGVGWGEMLAKHFDDSQLQVVNRAVGGRSSRSYWREKRWQSVRDQLQPGDFVIMQFGHNDGGRVGDLKFKRRPSLPGIGDETQSVVLEDGSTEVVRTYGWYLTQFCQEANKKQAIPIICSPVPHKDNWNKDVFTPDFVDHRKWCRQVAAKTGAHFVDLTAIVGKQYQAMGEAEVAELFADERTHTNAEGADVTAECVVAGLKGLSGNPLQTKFSTIGHGVVPERNNR